MTAKRLYTSTTAKLLYFIFVFTVIQSDEATNCSVQHTSNSNSRSNRSDDNKTRDKKCVITANNKKQEIVVTSYFYKYIHSFKARRVV